MSLKYILDRVKSSVGATSTDLNAQQRLLLLDFINEAANEIYDSIDLPYVLQECYVQVDTDNLTIALPPFVGEIRAMRDTREYPASGNNKWSLIDTRPRYTRKDWEMKWNKVRILKESPIVTDLTDALALTFEIETADSDIIVTAVGETEYSNRAIDNVTMSATSNSGTEAFMSIRSLKKNKVSNHNILVKDANDVELAIIYADRLESNYKIVDISEYPSLHTCGEYFVMEVLYKPALNRLYLDNDEFPLVGYDDVLVLKTKQLLAEEQPGKEQRAILMDQKAQRKINQKIIDKTGTNQKRLVAARNPFFGISRRHRRII